jgi:hypothetical protein
MARKLENEPRPFTYANEGRARHYVGNLTRAGIQSGPVYLIVSPSMRTNKKTWGMLLNSLREILPGIEFRLWPQVAREAERAGANKIKWLVDNHAGAIIIGFRHHHLLRVGPVALAEATAFAAHGKPAFAFTGRRLIAWPDCQVLKIPEDSRIDRFTTAYIALPLQPETKPFPTFTASCHMLGIRNPVIISRAAGIGTERPRPRPRAPRMAGSRGPRSGRLVTTARTRPEVL